MGSRVFFSFFIIVSLAGTLVRFVPPARKLPLVTPHRKIVQDLMAQVTQSAKSFRSGDFRQAAALSQQGYQDALRADQPKIAAYFLNNLGGCQFALRQYREALKTYLEARRLAEAAQDYVTAAKLSINISSLYTHLGQVSAAMEAAGRATARLSGAERRAQLPFLLSSLADLEARQGHISRAVDLYRQGIAASAGTRDLEIYATGWNNLGYLYLEQNQLPQAEPALLEAYRVRKLNHLRSIEVSYRNLGMLRLGQGDIASASLLLDQAVALSREPGGIVPDWEVHYARSRVLVRENRLADALDDLRISARLARNWRRWAFPDDATRISAENTIQKVHSALVETGNRLYFETGRPELSRETFESAEANRAASLRALLTAPRDWRRNLPAEYWETLRKLEATQVELLRTQGAPAASVEQRAQRFEGALIQWESQAASGADRELPDLLERTRRTLRPDTAFLSFHLAPSESYLWAVSRDDFRLYRLPPAPEIARLSADFSTAVRQGSAAALPEGARLFRALFGQLPPAFLQKRRWLLALDAQLFDLPFAALVEETGPRGPLFLAERHALQIASGAAMLAEDGGPRGVRDGPFLGVADAIYNTADPRWQGVRPASFLGYFAARAGELPPRDELHLARLAGSAREVAGCAAAWGGPRPPTLLEGRSACRRGVQAALAGQPAVLHFATHVVNAGQGNRSGLIVLSLDSEGQRELLSPVEIATWNLDGALVALSGCGSGSAEALPATGLMGLTRACQAAGAAAVIASRWPTPDDAGSLFLAFYGHLRVDPAAGPAAALRLAQIDMLRSGTWRAQPRYWAAYFITGNRQ